MTAGNNGTPENGEDDPFGYLYQGNGEQAAAPDRPGVPRTSYHQVSRVGERRGAPQQQSGYGYPQQQQPAYGGQQPQQQQHTQQQQPAGPRAGGPDQPRGGRAAERAAVSGSNRSKGLMIGAVAVVVVVAVGIGIAMTGDHDKGHKNAGPTAQPTGSAAPTPTSSAGGDPNANLPKQFAASLTLGGQAAVASTDQGAQGPNGSYVTIGNVGDSVTWKVTVPSAGTYKLYIGYGNAGQPASATLSVNGTAQSRPVNLDNFAKADDPAHAWTQTWQLVNVKQGDNTITLSCAQGNQCAFDLDRFWLHTNSDS